MRRTDPFSETHEERVFLRLGKKRSRVKFLIRQNNYSFNDILVFKTIVLLRPKHIEVFHTSLFLETEVL
jgi:hypothetical protein